jgi:large subunit ribosomal protein L17
MRNLTMALIRSERIITTVEKAKEARRFVEKLITLAKKGTLHARRLVLARLGTAAHAEINPEGETEADRKKVVAKLFDELGPRYRDRSGGYTRVIKRHERRLGDGGQTAFLELLKDGETKIRSKKPAAALAPRLAPAEPEAAAPATPAPPAESEGGTPTMPGENPPAS